MDSEEKSNVARKEPSSLGGVARRLGGALANLVPNSRPVYRERLEDHGEPRFSFDPAAGDAAPSSEPEWFSKPIPDGVHSLDAQREKRGSEKRELDSPREPPPDRQARSLDALRKKKSA